MKPSRHRTVAQTSQSAVSQVSKPARRGSLQSRQLHNSARPADLEIGDTAGLETCATNRQTWLIWQLIDSAFPTGGFAHSAGLEAAWQHGEIRGRSDLESFTRASVVQLARASSPFVTTAWNQPDRLQELDDLFEVFTTNHVANRASRLQGKAFLAAVTRIFPTQITSRKSSLVSLAGHFAPVFGVSLRALDIPLEVTAPMFIFNHVRGVLAAAVRLNIVGPMEAQCLQQSLSPTAEEALQRSLRFTLDDIAQTAPLLDLWQGAHDRLYSRLFQS